MPILKAYSDSGFPSFRCPLLKIQTASDTVKCLKIEVDESHEGTARMAGDKPLQPCVIAVVPC
jgi:hypothetical protein